MEMNLEVVEVIEIEAILDVIIDLVSIIILRYCKINALLDENIHII